jgi:hypothetical protein
VMRADGGERSDTVQWSQALGENRGDASEKSICRGSKHRGDVQEDEVQISEANPWRDVGANEVVGCLMSASAEIHAMPEECTVRQICL